MQQLQSPCSTCRGSGLILEETERCVGCTGTGTVDEINVICVDIKAGTSDGERVYLKGQADEAPGLERGDLVFIIKQKPHNVFQRGGRNSGDLMMQKEVPLLDALVGFEMTVKHLDGRDLLFSSRGRVLKPEDVYEVKNEGMPIKDSNEKGNLYIKFRLQFPLTNLNAEQAKQLAGCGLPRLGESDHSGIPTTMVLVDLHNPKVPQDPDDGDYEYHQPGVQCRPS